MINKNSVRNSERPQNNNLKSFKKGQSGNPNGRPIGRKNYETLIREGIFKYAKLNGKTEEEVELLIHMKGIDQAIRGEYSFYKDYMDRMHGRAKEMIDLQMENKTTKLEELLETTKKILEK